MEETGKDNNPNPKECWENPANWTTVLGRRMIYSAEEDDRIFVPKAPVFVLGHELHLGWTLNFAHRESYVTLAGLIASAVALTVFSKKRRNV